MRAAGMTAADLADQVGRDLYGAPFYRSTVYRWLRLEAPIAVEVLLFVLERAGMTADQVLAGGEVAARLGRIEEQLGAQREILERLATDDRGAT